MSIIEILKFLFTKINISKEGLDSIFDSLFKIPAWLKKTLISVLLIGVVYYGYQKLYQNEIDELKAELTDLRDALAVSVNAKDYSDDIFYLISAIKTTEAVQKYAYEEQQLQLSLIEVFIQKYHPNDAILYDIDAMKKRNERHFNLYHAEFERAISSCKRSYFLNDK